METEQRLADRKFHLGGLSMTRGAQWALLENNVTPTDYLARHVRGDWGDVSDNDRAENEFAIGRELRIWSVYHRSGDLGHHRSRPLPHNDSSTGGILIGFTLADEDGCPR
jgi:hypothetical protein